MLKRKVDLFLKEWKENINRKPLIISGARQIGKTTSIREFGKSYESFIEIDFVKMPKFKTIFKNGYDVNDIIKEISLLNPKFKFVKNNTLILFDEIQEYPDAATSLKPFSEDGRFDVICSGSLLGVNYKKISSIPVGFKEDYVMYSLDFEEFLWANGYSENQVDDLKKYYENGEFVPEVIHNKFNELFLNYIVVGGMPEVVKKFVETNDIREAILKQKAILNDYNNDIAKYASNNDREKVRECYDSIPNQLAKENKKFMYKMVKEGTNSRYYESSLEWINQSGLTNKVYRLKCFDIPLKAYRDLSTFKMYFNDTGLLLSMYEENVQFSILRGDLGVFKGGIFENVIAQILKDNNMPIYYYRRDDRLEIDFVTYLNGNIVPIEVKSGHNTKSLSLRNVINENGLKYGIKLSLNNVNCSDEKIKCYPLYMCMFIR